LRSPKICASQESGTARKPGTRENISEEMSVNGAYRIFQITARQNSRRNQIEIRPMISNRGRTGNLSPPYFATDASENQPLSLVTFQRAWSKAPCFAILVSDSEFLRAFEFLR
jgi:hypothetical protein